MLGKKNTPKTQYHHEVLYSGFVTSPEGDFVGPDVKLQLICQCKYKFAYTHKSHCPKCGIEINKIENPKYYKYVFYRNITKNKKKEKTKYLKESQITEKILSYFEDNLTMSPALTEWAKKHFREMADGDVQRAELVKNKISDRLGLLEAKKTKYRDMYADGLSSKEEYLQDVSKIEREISEIKSQKTQSFDWLSKADEIVSIGHELSTIFSSEGNVKGKRSILNRLGSNIVWNEEIVYFINTKAVQTLMDGLSEAKRISVGFEPKNILDTSEQNVIFQPVINSLLALKDDFRTIDWAKEYPFPTIALEQIKMLLVDY